MAKRKAVKRKSKSATIRNIIVVSDTHCGCRLGLCPPHGASLDDGGGYKPSRLQAVVWSWWREFWDEWVPHATHGEPFCVVMNGDMVEGVHHGSTSQISNNLEDQAAIAYEVFSPIVELCGGRFYMIRGTGAHVGQQAVDEERLAKRLGAIPNEDGQYSRYELWKHFGDAGDPKLAHFNHHIGTTSSSAHEVSAVNAELSAAFVEAGRWGNKPPDVICRSHRHRQSEIRIPSQHGVAIAFVTAAWQLKGQFAYKVAGARQTTPQIGGSLIRQSDDEELYTRHFVRDIGRSKPE